MRLRNVIWILVAVLLIVAAFLNPNLEQHKLALKPKVKAGVAEALKGNGVKTDNMLYNLVTDGIYESYLWKDLVENEVTRDNYLFFSISKCSYLGEEYPVGVGVLGKVFIFPQVQQFVTNLFDDLIKKGGGLNGM